MNLQLVQQEVETHLERIEKVLGPNYKLTLVATHDGTNGLKDADLLLTMAKREEIMRAVDRFLPPSDKSRVSACYEATATGSMERKWIIEGIGPRSGLWLPIGETKYDTKTEAEEARSKLPARFLS